MMTICVFLTSCPQGRVVLRYAQSSQQCTIKVGMPVMVKNKHCIFEFFATVRIVKFIFNQNMYIFIFKTVLILQYSGQHAPKLLLRVVHFMFLNSTMFSELSNVQEGHCGLLWLMLISVFAISREERRKSTQICRNEERAPP